MRYSLFPKRKYLLRVVIELALIIVGVLSALAVENWREATLEKETGRAYLLNLRDAVQADTAMIKGEIKKALEKKNAATQMLELLKTNERLSPEEFTNVIENILVLVSSAGTTAVYEELKYTGNLKLITNSELKNAIFTYYNDLSTLNTQMQAIGIGYNYGFLDTIDFDELTYENEFSQEVIINRIRKNKEVSFYIRKLQRTMHYYQHGLIYSILPNSLDLLDKINHELERQHGN